MIKGEKGFFSRIFKRVLLIWSLWNSTTDSIVIVAEEAKLGKIMTTNHKFGLLRLLHKQKSHKRDGWWTYIYGTYVICMLSQIFAKQHHIMQAVGGFICTFSLLISLSITLQTSKFRNQFTISSKYFDMACYLK